MVSKKEIKTIFKLLDKTHPLTMLEQLKDYSAYQMLIATLLSARTKDATVIPIIKDFFKHFPEAKDVAKLNHGELEKWFYKIGFYKNKAKNVKELSKKIITDFNSIVPKTMEELMILPGVGRKTANCLLAYKFNIPAIAVDVHVHRIANRLGWVKTKTPEETEKKLLKLVPKENWIDVNKYFVGHGQTICKPIGPLCEKCNIVKFCELGRKRMSNK